MRPFCIDGYKELINDFLDAGYSFNDFSLTIPLNGVVLLRHDIDFCVGYALDIAKAEQEMGVSSSFFVMTSNVLYNPFARKNLAVLEQISQMGHRIRLHIDEEEIRCEDDFFRLRDSAKMLMPFLDTNVISRHRPKSGVQMKGLPNDVLDTYHPHFFVEMEYASDSKGIWRYGYPSQREAFKCKKSYQLLTHPMWWVVSGNNQEKVSKMLDDRSNDGAESISYLKNI